MMIWHTGILDDRARSEKSRVQELGKATPRTSPGKVPAAALHGSRSLAAAWQVWQPAVKRLRAECI